MSKPGQGPGTYVHPTLLDDSMARKVTRLCLRDGQSFAVVRDGRAWQVWCPEPDKARLIDFIEVARGEP